MASCAFFGHRDLHVEPYREKLIRIITDLIEYKGVTQFYSGYRGDFDVYCSRLVGELKSSYPDIKNTMALSYMPVTPVDKDNAFRLPDCFDDSVYLLERKVPEPLAIIETNKCIVDISDYIVAGMIVHGGGAYSACVYAKKKGKPIISMIDGWKV